MNSKLALIMVLGVGCAVQVHAADTAAAARKQADARYAEDRKLCAEESSSGTRMQCLRDARSEYDKALAAARTMPSQAVPLAKPVVPAAKPSPAAACAECGKVVAVNVVEQAGESSPLGLIAGGVAGAMLGHQVGQGRGKDLATLAGAAGGAYAGHKIEQTMKAQKTWSVRVMLDSGEDRVFNFNQDPGYAAGDLVKVSGGGLIRR